MRQHAGTFEDSPSHETRRERKATLGVYAKREANAPARQRAARSKPRGGWKS